MQFVTYSPQSCPALRMEASMQNDEPDAVYVARSTQSAQCRALPRELGKSHELRQKRKSSRERREKGVHEAGRLTYLDNK